MTSRTFAVGDIHGCSAALWALIEAIEPSVDDTIITLGDYIDRGPDSKGVIDQLIAVADRCNFIPLMGNHEEMFFGAMDSRSGLAFWMQFGAQEMLDSYGPTGGWEIIPRAHVEFLRSCRRYYETDTHIFAHAGYWPNRKMDDQPTSALMWEMLEPAKAAPHFSRKKVVVGHTPQPNGQILDLGFLICIDTNCCEGGWLTALDVTTGQVWQANQQGEAR